MKRLTGFVGWGIGLLLLVSCESGVGSPVPTIAATALLTKVATITPLAIQPTAQVTVIKNTFTPPMAELTPSLIYVPLTNRQPTIQELQDYLYDTVDHDLSIMGTGITDRQTVVYFEDMNGDNEKDLVVAADNKAIIMLWQEKNYRRPMIWDAYQYGICCGTSVISLEDWTNDGTPELVFDDTAIGGGSGIFFYDTARTIIHCEGETCFGIWGGFLHRSVVDNICGGMEEITADMHLTADQNNRPMIRHITSGFAVYYCVDSSDIPPDPSILRIFESTLTEYIWDGSSYVKVSEQVVSLPTQIPSQASLAAVSPNGTKAVIQWEPIPTADNQNDLCRLIIEGVDVNSLFGCKSNFVTVQWQDITGDSQSEVIVIALSGAYSGYEGVIDENCVHQRLLAYQWDGATATEIANVAGCVERADLFGVALEDYDSDGQPEILTPGKIYKWNGTKFVFWDYVPEK